MSDVALLAPEWERIDLLGACLSMARRGDEISEAMGERLGQLQQSVLASRGHPPWTSLVEQCRLDRLDQDILACCLAPQAESRLGWMFQELQPGIASHFPTPALMREILFLTGDEAMAFNQRFSGKSALVVHQLIEGDRFDLYQPVRPTEQASSRLLGWAGMESMRIPGALEIPVQAGWNDLVLPERCIRSLREFLLWVTHRQQVGETWGARIGGGPVALFSGPSGTGKTFAAEVLAGELGWPLFRVDLGMLVSKYIGETEKNLNALFDAAHGQAVVLLFDEADSLFGRRGDVKDARDRYANMEVSHLLSRIERHQGPCILTSNLRQHLDPAFARRFQIIVDFPRPDAGARAALWSGHIPAAAPCDADVDPVLLGNELGLTGGQIRNAALHAAFLAAGEGGPLSLHHIVRAVWTEMAKDGKEMLPSSLGKLAGYLPEADHV